MSALAEPKTTSGGELVVLKIGGVCVLEGFMAKERSGCLPFDGFMLRLRLTVLFVWLGRVFWVWR